MPNDHNARIKEILDQMVVLENVLFPGYDATKIKEIVEKKLKYLDESYKKQLSDIFSFGGLILPRGEARPTRLLKGLTLLFQHVMCYRKLDATINLRNTLVKLNEVQTKVHAKYYTKIGVDYLLDDEKWAREIPPWYGGSLVHYYNQGKDPRLQQSYLTENGWCLGMSVHWLGCKSLNQDMWANHMTPERAQAYKFIMAAQAIRTQGVLGNTPEDRAAFRLRRFDLEKVTKITSPNGDATAQRLAQNIIKSPCPFIRIGQYYVEGGGHAMAAFLKNNTTSLMDPNLGEFSFNSREKFADWYPNFTRFMDYNYKEHYIEQYNYKSQVKVSNIIKTEMEKRRLAMGFVD